MRLEKQHKKEENEQKIRKTLKQNLKLMTERKNKIIRKIRLKENNTQKAWKIKKQNLEKMYEINMGKQMEREFKVQEVKQQNINMINDTEKKLCDKNNKINYFLEQKQLINEQKKLFSDEINKEKEFYSEKIHNLFGKKTINKKTLNEIKDKFSNNPQISNIINEFKELNNL